MVKKSPEDFHTNIYSHIVNRKKSQKIRLKSQLTTV